MSENKKDWLEEYHKEIKNLEIVSKSLINIAIAFDTVGNQAMGDLLAKYSNLIDSSIENIKKNISLYIKENQQYHQDNGDNLLKAVIVGRKMVEQE